LKSVWKGSISLGGVFNIPAKIYKATEAGNGVQFRQLCPVHATPIRQPKWCDKCGREIPYNELLKGYEIGKDRFVKLTKQEVEELKPENEGRVEILTIKDASDIDLISLDEHYYVVPDKSDAAFVLLRHTLSLKAKVAVGKIVMRNRERLCIIAPYKEWLVLHTLFYPSEIRSVEQLPAPKVVAIREQEVELAKMLIERIAENGVKIEELRDEYRQKIEELIRRKVSGEEVAKVEVEEPKPVPSALDEVLKKAIEALERKKKKEIEVAQ
jgi:DNA end-binding protein Ku